MTYAIVVKVPEAQRHCFVAIPYSGFDDLGRAIDQAVLATNLKPLHLGRTNIGPDLIANVHKAIRSAQLVVAVVTPEPTTGAPNPNVLYELGFARALGKPVLTLYGDDFRSLPTDLHNQRDLVLYTAADDPSALSVRITKGLYEVLGRLHGNPLVDPSYDPETISLAQARHQWLLDPKWWDLFVTVTRFAKDVHNAFQPFDTQVDEFQRQASRLLDGAVQVRQAFDLATRWQVTRRSYEANLIANNLRDPRERWQEVDSCYSAMSTMMHQPPKPFGNSQVQYASLRRSLESYPDHFYAIDRNRPEELSGLARQDDGASHVCKGVLMLSQETKSLVVSADQMLRDLLTLMLEEVR